jgi:hypothetical protein
MEPLEVPGASYISLSRRCQREDLITGATGPFQRMKGKMVRKIATVAVEIAQEIDLGEGSSISYLPECFSADKADAWFETLESNLPWQRPEIFVRGRRTLQVIVTTVCSMESPRFVAWKQYE